MQQRRVNEKIKRSQIVAVTSSSTKSSDLLKLPLEIILYISSYLSRLDQWNFASAIAAENRDYYVNIQDMLFRGVNKHLSLLDKVQCTKIKTHNKLSNLIQLIYEKTGDRRIFAIKILILIGQISPKLLIDIHNQVFSITHEPTSADGAISASEAAASAAASAANSSNADSPKNTSFSLPQRFYTEV